VPLSCKYCLAHSKIFTSVPCVAWLFINLLIRFTDVKYFYHCHGVVVESGKMKKNSNFGVNLMMDVCKQDGKVWEGSCL